MHPCCSSLPDRVPVISRGAAGHHSHVVALVLILGFSLSFLGLLQLLVEIFDCRLLGANLVVTGLKFLLKVVILRGQVLVFNLESWDSICLGKCYTKLRIQSLLDDDNLGFLSLQLRDLDQLLLLFFH